MTTDTTTMLTKNTSELRQLVQQHVAADQAIQGTYWDAENSKGCFIGCLNHSSNPRSAEQRFGLPIMIQRIAESIFEGLPPDEARAFFAALPDAVECDGKDLSHVGWQFLASELRALPPQNAEIQSVIDPVIAGMDLLACGQEWPAAARAAARAADSAAVSAAAKAAAKAAASAADAAAAWTAAAAAAWAANSAAAWAADSAAACAAVRRRQRDCLLELIAAAPVVPSGEVQQ